MTLFTLITEYPLWFVLFAVLTGAAYALILYYKNRKSGLNKTIRTILAIFRFIVVTLLVFLLLSPLIKTNKKDLEKPIIIIAHDNSESIITYDSVKWLPKYRNELKSFIKNIKKDFDVVTCSFGEQYTDSMPLDFSDKKTNISELLEVFQTKYTGRNAGAYIIASDGIYNYGFNPVYQLNRFMEPFYTIALGDTTQKRDLLISEVSYNRIAYMGNDFPVEIVVRAEKCKGETSRIVIKHKGKTLVNQILDINRDAFTKSFSFVMNADEAGLQNYFISITPVKNEVTHINNSRRLFIDVLDSKRKILILGSSPHPDIAAIKRAIESNQNYEIDVKMSNEISGSLINYNLIILHQIPSTSLKENSLFQQIIDEKIPRLVIIGNSTHLPSLNQAKTGIRIDAKNLGEQTSEAIAALNTSFSIFQPNTSFTDLLNNLPPLIAPFGNYIPNVNQQTLLFQKIGAVTTKYPLIAFYPSNDIRSGIVFGEGLWKWRLYAYKNSKSHDAFNQFINKIIQYLSVKKEKKRFMVFTERYFTENNPVTFSAELYNKSFVPTTDPDVKMVVTDENKKQFTYLFTKRDKNYSLNTGKLPVGEYRYVATTNIGNDRFLASGKFIVAPLDVENTVTRADHALMAELGKRTNGDMFYPDELSDLEDAIRQNKNIIPVSHTREKFTDILNLEWILVLIVLLLSLEWFLRKRAGSY